MKKKNIFNGFFWVWLITSAVLVGAMLITGQPHANWMASAILALFMVLPVRDWMYRFVVWAIEYVCSNHPSIKGKIIKHATILRLTEHDDKNRIDNAGFYRSLNAVIGVICVIMGLLWLVFQKTSLNVVYTWLHTIEFIFRGEIGFLALLLYVLITLGYIYLIYWFVGQVLNGNLHNNSSRLDWIKCWWRILIVVVGFYGKIIISGILLKFTTGMIGSNLLFWTIVVGFPIAVFEFRKLIRIIVFKIRLKINNWISSRRSNSNPNP